MSYSYLCFFLNKLSQFIWPSFIKGTIFLFLYESSLYIRDILFYFYLCYYFYQFCYVVYMVNIFLGLLFMIYSIIQCLIILCHHVHHSFLLDLCLWDHIYGA